MLEKYKGGNKCLPLGSPEKGLVKMRQQNEILGMLKEKDAQRSWWELSATAKETDLQIFFLLVFSFSLFKKKDAKKEN